MLQLPSNSPAHRKAQTVRIVNSSEEDGTFARIARHRDLGAQILDLSEQEDVLCAAAEKTLGRRPFALIAWRNYSAIGGSEIERARQEFLEVGVSPDVVEREYRDAKMRFQKRKADCRHWRKAAGIYRISKDIEAAIQERWDIIKSFVDQPPQSAKAASALISYLIEFYDGCEFDERGIECLRAVAEFLATADDGRAA